MALPAQKLAELKEFVNQLKANPQALHMPELSFFKDFIIQLGGKLPDIPKEKNIPSPTPPTTETKPTASNSCPCTGNTCGASDPCGGESDDVTGDEGDIPATLPEVPLDDDNDLIPRELDQLPPLAPQGDKEFNEDELIILSELKESAQEDISNDKLSSALDTLTKVVQMGNPSALLYCKRADLLLKLKRPVACVRDCDEAIKLNPDNGRAYRLRGKAYRYLGDYCNAHKDIHQGQTIDYDESLAQLQKFVDDRFTKIESHRREWERNKESFERRRKVRDIKRRKKQAQRAYEQAKKDKEEEEEEYAGMGGPGGMGGMPGGMPGGMGGMPGGMPGGMGGMPGGMDMSSLLTTLLGNDPEIQSKLKLPKVQNALKELFSNPSSAAKHLSDPDIAPVLLKVQQLLGSVGGGAGGMPGMPGMGGMGGMGGDTEMD
eukprot:GHVR01120233.1.p1 GENE.GHVR01120233.1~~GHVR01120233.1.p1  ORF type:complete len:432 (+),score=149.71 GHVR01120233.1:51-1346(+)